MTVPSLFQNIWWKRHFSFQSFSAFCISFLYGQFGIFGGKGGHGRQFKQKCEKKKWMKIGRMTIITIDINLVTCAEEQITEAHD